MWCGVVCVICGTCEYVCVVLQVICICVYGVYVYVWCMYPIVVCMCDVVYACGVVCIVHMCMCGVNISGGGDGGGDVCRSQKSLISWND